jgi:hypothetical protein
MARWVISMGSLVTDPLLETSIMFHENADNSARFEIETDEITYILSSTVNQSHMPHR